MILKIERNDDITEILEITPEVFHDRRGFYMETWHANKFSNSGIDAHFVQDNHSKSSKNILRGLHYQIKQPQGKLARVINGEVFDVSVDLRKHSPTFGKWAGVILSEDNRKMLWIPPGFAHGFYVISDEAEFLYKCTDFYAPQYERCIRWDDPDLAIFWPVPAGQTPELSEKDSCALSFHDAEKYK